MRYKVYLLKVPYTVWLNYSFTTPNVRTTCRIWKIITFLEFLSQCRRSDILLNKIEALLIFDPLITLWGHFKAAYFKMLNDARVATACLHVRTCQRVRNSKNIATVRDFQVHVCVNSTMVFDSGYIYGVNFIAKFRCQSGFLRGVPWNPPWTPTGVKVHWSLLSDQFTFHFSISLLTFQFHFSLFNFTFNT